MTTQESKRLTTEELDTLRDIGVSPEALTIMRRAPETVGRERNSAREKARGLLRSTREVSLDNLTGGDYFTALRDGNLGKAFIYADITNTRLLVDTYGRDYLIERLCADEGYTSESAARRVDEAIEEFCAGVIP